MRPLLTVTLETSQLDSRQLKPTQPLEGWIEAVASIQKGSSALTIQCCRFLLSQIQAIVQGMTNEDEQKRQKLKDTIFNLGKLLPQDKPNTAFFPQAWKVGKETEKLYISHKIKTQQGSVVFKGEGITATYTRTQNAIHLLFETNSLNFMKNAQLICSLASIYRHSKITIHASDQSHGLVPYLSAYQKLHQHMHNKNQSIPSFQLEYWGQQPTSKAIDQALYELLGDNHNLYGLVRNA